MELSPRTQALVSAILNERVHSCVQSERIMKRQLVHGMKVQMTIERFSCDSEVMETFLGSNRNIKWVFNFFHRMKHEDHLFSQVQVTNTRLPDNKQLPLVYTPSKYSLQLCNNTTD